MKITFPPLRRTARVVMTIGIILTAMTALAAPTWQGREDYEEGILTIYNPSEPLNEPSVITPEPQWRIGGDDDEAETLFGLITDAQRKPDGTTYLLDAIMSTVYEVDASGEVRRTLGREGDGPGEFRNSRSLALMPDSGVGIVEMMPSRMVVLGPDGVARPSIDLGDGSGGRSMVELVAVADDLMVMGMFSMKFNEGAAEISHMLASFNLDGTLRNKLLFDSETQTGGSISISAGNGDDFVSNWAMDSKGQVAVYRRANEYLVEVFGTDGAPKQRIRREYKSVRRSEEDIQAQREQQEQMRARFGSENEMEIQEMANDIDSIVPRPNGDLWVLSSQGQQDCPAGFVGAFDVFDAKGRFVRQTRIAADFDADDDQYLIRDNHLYILKEANNAPDRTMSGGGGNMMMVISGGNGGSDDEDEDEDEEPKPYEVICYELPGGI